MEPGDERVRQAAIPGLSLTGGGSFHRILVALGARTPGGALRVAFLIGLFAWAPLLVASMAEGALFGGPGAFVHDVGVHARFLLALPLLLFAEVPIGRRLDRAVRYLSEAGLVHDGNRAAALAAIRRAERLRDRRAPELALAVAAFALSLVDLRYEPLGPATWIFPAPGEVSVAGWIALFLSVPLARFVMLRWGLRFVVWAMLLAGLARARLRINAAHPDGRGGLAFVWDSHVSFAWLALGAGIALAGNLTTEKLLTGASVMAYRTEVLAFSLGAPLLFLSPLFVFAWPIEQARRRFFAEYGSAAADFVDRYARAWLDPSTREQLPLGTGETSAHTDMVTSFQRVESTRWMPFSKRHFFTLFLAAGLPMLIFALQEIPLADVLRRLKDIVG